MTSPVEDAALEERISRAVGDALGAEVRGVEWIAGHLGLRRFARVFVSGGGLDSLIARLEAPEDPAGRPPGVPPEPPLEPVRAFYARAGLPVPARLGADEPAGIELLEDLGSLSLADAARAASPAEREALYREACSLVPRIQALADPGDLEAFRRRLDAPLFRYKADLFCRWGLGREATAAERRVVTAAFEHVAEVSAAAPARLAHRDLQGSNVLVRAEEKPGSRLALIDLQGAFLAPPEYDLVCLLRDSYVELAEPEVRAQLRQVVPQLPDAPDPADFDWRFDLLTLTRKSKDLARFVYAEQTRGAREYRRYLPPTLRTLRRAAERAAEREPDLDAFKLLLLERADAPCEA